MTRLAERPLLPWLLLGAPLALTVLAIGWSLLGASFVDDDWFWLALVRHLDHPGMAYTSGLLHEYFYRPSSIALWWIAERLFGDWAGGHYLVDLLLHTGAALVLALLIRTLTPNAWLPAVMGALIFALLPSTLGTVLWLSNRNELLAVFAGLAFLATLERGRSNRIAALWAALWLTLAVTAKETGLIFAVIGGLRMAWWTWRRESAHPLHWLALMISVSLLLLMRQLTILPVGVGTDWAALQDHASTGVFAWFRWLPQALSGLDPRAWPGQIFLATMGLGVVLAFAGWRRTGRAALLAVAIAFLLLPPLLQWPITHFVLTADEAGRHVVNLRFFYLASGGAAVLAAAALSSVSAWRWPMALGVVTSLVLMTPRVVTMVDDWTVHSGAIGHAIVDLAQKSEAQIHCQNGQRWLLAGDRLPPGFSNYADVAVKAVAARTTPLLGCALFTPDHPPFHSILSGDLCSTSEWPNLPTRHSEPFPLMRRFGNLCLAAFHSPAPDDPLLQRPDLSVTDKDSLPDTGLAR